MLPSNKCNNKILIFVENSCHAYKFLLPKDFMWFFVVHRTWVTRVKTSHLIHPSSNYTPNNFASFGTIMIILEIHGQLMGQSQQRPVAKWYWTLRSPTEIMLKLFFFLQTMPEEELSDTDSWHNWCLALLIVVAQSPSSSPWFIS